MQPAEPMNGYNNAGNTPGIAHSRPDTAIDQQLPPELQTPTNERPIHTNGHQPKLSEKEPAADFSRHTSPETDNISYPSDEKGDSPIARDGRAESSFHDKESGYRTISLKNLPERAMHQDIVGAVRGGALVDVFLRARERTASVTFADPKAANEYLAYARRWNVYVLGKPVLNAMPCNGCQVFANLPCFRSKRVGANVSSIFPRTCLLSYPKELLAILSSVEYIRI